MISTTIVTSLLLDIPAPIFAAAWAKGALIVHLAATPGRSAVKAQIERTLADAGVERVRVRFHGAASLHAPRSLERLVAKFAGDEIAYDPTGAVARARTLVAAGRELRAALDAQLFGLYYAPRQRTVFVALKANGLAHGDKIKVAALADIERAVTRAMSSAFAGSLADCPAVRVGFGLPVAGLVAVDARSVVHWSARIARAIRRLWKPVTIAALFGFGMAGTAAADGSSGNRGPAVSETNLKLSGAAGVADDDGAWQAGGALTAPLGQFTGVQLEAGAAGTDDDSTWGAGLHLFTRDPDNYLIGLFAAYGHEDNFDIDATRVGLEAEIYLRQLSVLVQGGYQFTDSFAGLDNDTPFGSIDLRWYATDNFFISGGGYFEEDVALARLQAEFMPGFSALPGLAFNIKGTLGDDDYESILGGITYYFGSDASLKDRHRKQDPDSALLNLFHSVEKERANLEAIYGTHHAPH